VLDATVDQAPALTSTVVSFWPHPRIVLGNEVGLLTTLERRLELLADSGIDETLVVEFTQELAQMAPETFVDEVLRPIGTELVVAGTDFRFGRGRAGDLDTLERLGLTVERVDLVPGVSSTAIRGLLRDGDVGGAARLLGRPAEVEGTVVSGDARGGTLGYPTANLRVEADLLVPAYGIYAGSAAGHRAAVSIGTNPHYGGQERRVEAFLLDFAGDLYGERLAVELWERLREEQVFVSETELIEQIGRDVEATRAAERPV
jgi:riboflavin kinase/FMN adenylyltransferase